MKLEISVVYDNADEITDVFSRVLTAIGELEQLRSMREIYLDGFLSHPDTDSDLDPTGETP